jgi:hypothetical protein
MSGLCFVSSPFKVKEDDDVDNLEIELAKKKSKRVYQSLSPEVGLKISRSLKVSLLVQSAYTFYIHSMMHEFHEDNLEPYVRTCNHSYVSLLCGISLSSSSKCRLGGMDPHPARALWSSGSSLCSPLY